MPGEVERYWPGGDEERGRWLDKVRGEVELHRAGAMAMRRVADAAAEAAVGNLQQRRRFFDCIADLTTGDILRVISELGR